MQYGNKLLPGLEDLKPTPALLNSLLEELDYTNAMAAEVGGTTYQTIGRWLTGENPIHRGVFRLFLVMCYLKRGQAMIRVSWSTPRDVDDDVEALDRNRGAADGAGDIAGGPAASD